MPQTKPSRILSLQRLSLVIIISYHLARLTVFFGGPQKIISDEPLIRNDHGWHYYYTVIGSGFLQGHGSPSGYDPALMAGYPTDVFDASDRLIKVLYTLIPLSSPAAAYKVAMFLTAAAAPALFWLFALSFGLNRRERLVTCGLGVWLWWSNLGDNLFAMGLVGFLLASIWGLVTAGWFNQHWRNPTLRSWSILTGCFIAALWVHPGIAPIMGAPILAILWLKRSDFNLKAAAALVPALGLAFGASLVWMIPQMVNVRWAHGSATHFQSISLFAGLMAKGLASGGKIILAAIFPAAAAGLLMWRREGRRDLFWIFIWSLGILFFIAAFGFYFPFLKWTQPARYAAPALFLMLAPAATAVIGWIQRIKRSGVRKNTALPLLLLSVMAVSAIRFVAGTGSAHLTPPLVGVMPDVARVQDFLARYTDKQRRVLMEDKGPINEIFKHSFPAAYLSLATDRQIIGGPHWANFLDHHHADLSGIILMGRDLRTWTKPQLEQMVRGYNIGWVIAAFPLVRQLFDRHPDLFVPVDDQDGFKIYRVDRPGSYFVKGRGEVEAEPNLIRVKNARPGPEGMVISYHWHPWLRTDPPRRLYRADYDEDPVGFIGIGGPGGDFDIYFTYPWERKFWQSD